MIFNYTKNLQFNTRLKVNNVTLNTVNETKLLGTYITSDLKWDTNIFLVKKANSSLELLRKLSTFKASIKDLKIYI